MYKLDDRKFFCDIANGIALVLGQETGIYYAFNALGTSVLENLMKGVAPDEIARALSSAPDAPSDIRAKVEEFVHALTGFGILVKGGANAGTAEIDAGIAKGDNFMLDVCEYADAKDLLLADPIHDVSDSQEWAPEAIFGK